MSAAVTTEIAIGACCKFSDLYRAVTVISSRAGALVSVAEFTVADCACDGCVPTRLANATRATGAMSIGNSRGARRGLDDSLRIAGQFVSIMKVPPLFPTIDSCGAGGWPHTCSTQM
jgi:hypothetical protein